MKTMLMLPSADKIGLFMSRVCATFSVSVSPSSNDRRAVWEPSMTVSRSVAAESGKFAYGLATMSTSTLMGCGC